MARQCDECGAELVTVRYRYGDVTYCPNCELGEGKEADADQGD